MMGRLINPTRARIERMAVDVEMDPDYGGPVKTRNQLREEGYPFQIETVDCQIVFNEFETLTPAYTGNEAAIKGHLVIEAETQAANDFRANDFLVAVYMTQLGIWKAMDARIFKVLPTAQYQGSFLFYHLHFAWDGEA